MTKTISITLVIQQDEEESVFLQKAVKTALNAFRKTHNEAIQPTATVAIPDSICQRRKS
jgi:hypothetical protein